MAKSDDKGGLLKDVTASGVVAPALAAATSFALMSRVGLVGSLIGTAITAGATAAATQVYKNMMAASAERLQRLAPTADVTHADGAAETASAGVPASHQASELTQIPGETVADPTATAVMPRTASGAGKTIQVPRAVAQDHPEAAPMPSTPIAGAHERMVASARRRHELQVRLALFSAIFAIVVALAVAGVILVVTSGHGLGPGTVASATQTDTTDTVLETTPNADTGKDAPPADENDEALAGGTNDGSSDSDPSANESASDQGSADDGTGDGSAPSGGVGTGATGDGGGGASDEAGGQHSGSGSADTQAPETESDPAPETGSGNATTGESATGAGSTQAP